ncbi:glycerophosphodiester phosphodiesterase [Corynebacterium kroppenstedtii]|uniref:glycerophosphodiester phosphodiesterase n=1 Tax=Corynebacterium sp. PCR 32 TaxID=3351342 RepID=UPI0030B74468
MEIIAHRGASWDQPEQTLSAYHTALDDGADGVECDIRLTKDGHIVCAHDRTFERVAGDKRPIAELTRRDLDSINVGTTDEPQQPLLFTTLLDLVEKHDCGLFVETKHPSGHGRLESELASLLRQRGHLDNPRLHVISFSPRSLTRMHNLTPTVHRILLRREFHHPLSPLFGRFDIPQAYGPSILNAKLWPRLIHRGDGCYTWTANTRSDVIWAATHGIDWLATDKPRQARAWMNEATMN